MLSKIKRKFPRWLTIINSSPTSYMLDLSDKEMGHEKNAQRVCEFLEQHTEITWLKFSKTNMNLPINSPATILVQIFPRLPVLTTVNFVSSTFSSEIFQLLSQNLSQSSVLTSLNLFNNYLRDKEAEILSSYFFGNQRLIYLDLTFNQIGADGVLALTKAFDKNQSIQIELAWNPIGFEGAKILSRTLVQKRISSFVFKKNNFNEASLLVLSGPLQQHPTLTALTFVCEKIAIAGANALCKIIQNSFHIQYIDICFNKISDLEIEVLAEGFKLNHTIETFDLSHNQIGSKGAIALTTAFLNHPTLRKLYLGGNQIGDEGGKAISQLLGFNTILQLLDISSNGINEEGGQALAAGFSQNRTLIRLDISSNKMGSKNVSSFAHGIENCITIQTLSLSGTDIDTAALSVLTQALEKNHNLTHLDMGYCEVEMLAAQSFLEVIKKLPRFVDVDFSYPNRSEELRIELVDTLIEHRKLRRQPKHNQFIAGIWTLAWDGLENSHFSFWKILPDELQGKILIFLCEQVSQDKSFGKHYGQLIGCVDFIFKHAIEAKQRIKEKNNQGEQKTLKILEKINKYGESTFSFFRPPRSLKRKKPEFSQDDQENSILKEQLDNLDVLKC